MNFKHATAPGLQLPTLLRGTELYGDDDAASFMSKLKLTIKSVSRRYDYQRRIYHDLVT